MKDLVFPVSSFERAKNIMFLALQNRREDAKNQYT